LELSFIPVVVQPQNGKVAAKPAADEEDSDEEEEKEEVKTPAKPSGGEGSKTIFVKNLAWGADYDTL
jgi:nucleolin